MVKQGTTTFDLEAVYVEEQRDVAVCYRCCKFGHLTKFCKEECCSVTHVAVDCLGSGLAGTSAKGLGVWFKPQGRRSNSSIPILGALGALEMCK
nr:unnamed protein product [Callosobruchus analis]